MSGSSPRALRHSRAEARDLVRGTAAEEWTG